MKDIKGNIAVLTLFVVFVYTDRRDEPLLKLCFLD